MKRQECRIRIVRDDGVEFTATDGSHEREWVIKYAGLEGFGIQSLTVDTTENVLGDGSTFEMSRVNEKDRTITCLYVGDKDRRTARNEAQAFFNPKHRFDVYLTFGSTTRWLECELYGFECELNRAPYPVEFHATMLCADPYFRDVYRNDRSFSDFIPMFGFPFVSHAAEDTGRNKDYPAGCVPSIRTYDGKNTIYNTGDVPCPFCAIIKAKGTIVNPTLVKEDTHVRVLVTMVEHDELIIDFEAKPMAKVTLNGTDVVNKLSKDTRFKPMEMDVGANTFSFDCDNENSAALADVRILYNPRHLGP